eukprot:6172374-Pleurochrysis_carterae.AAC.1
MSGMLKGQLSLYKVAVRRPPAQRRMLGYPATQSQRCLGRSAPVPASQPANTTAIPVSGQTEPSARPKPTFSSPSKFSRATKYRLAGYNLCRRTQCRPEVGPRASARDSESGAATADTRAHNAYAGTLTRPDRQP